jgi:hypothetical protein
MIKVPRMEHCEAIFDKKKALQSITAAPFDMSQPLIAYRLLSRSEPPSSADFVQVPSQV